MAADSNSKLRFFHSHRATPIVLPPTTAPQSSFRFSHHGRIPNFDSQGYPLNVGGRTGITGRGSLVSIMLRF